MKIIILFFPFILLGGPLSVISELDTTDGFIGDLFLWTIRVEGLDDQDIEFPELTSSNDTLSIKPKNFIYEDKKLCGIQYQIIAWDTGSFKTPAYSIQVFNHGDTIGNTIIADPVYFSISSILAASTKTDFQDIKGPVPVRGVFPLREIIFIFLIIFIVLSMAWIWRKRQLPKYQKVDYSILETPYERASRRIGELDDFGLTKEYYASLSHISREYVETKYFIHTLEMTTEEIDSSRFIFPVNDNCLSEWIDFLYDADQVKYARATPDLEKMSNDKKKVALLIEQL